MSKIIIDKERLKAIVKESYIEIKNKEINYQSKAKTVENIVEILKREVARDVD